jgi:hypothetical protein
MQKNKDGIYYLFSEDLHTISFKFRLKRILLILKKVEKVKKEQS